MKKPSNSKKKLYEGTNDNVNTSPIPKEIDSHYELYGKHVWEIKYYEKCEICNSHFDEFGFCACGSGKS